MNKTGIYRRMNIRFAPTCVNEVDSFDEGGVMEWEAIYNGGKNGIGTFSVLFKGSRYREDIFQPHSMHHIDRHKDIFQQENVGLTQRV